MAMMELSDVVRITGGRMIGQDVPIESVVIDGRRVAPGALFVAISGETFDGHEFLGQAASAGAATDRASRLVPLSFVAFIHGCFIFNYDISKSVL
jgi:UDP-N-acetylmuramoyl-tripeptide--D-alanyl-D-alanine ligase